MNAIVFDSFTTRHPGRSLAATTGAGAALNPSAGSMQVNVGGVYYYTSSNPVLNWWLPASSVTIWSQILAASWSSNQVTFTCGCNPNIAVGKTFIIGGMTPSGYNATFTAVSGTSGSTLVATLNSNPGAATVLGQLQLSGDAAWNAVGTAQAGGGTAYFNPQTGEVCNPCPSDLVQFERFFFTPPPNYQYTNAPNWWEGQVFYITWKGTSTPTSYGGGTGTVFTVTGPHSATWTFGTSVGNTALTFPIGNYNDPPRNIMVYQAQYASSVAAGAFFNPDWLSLIKPFGTLRVMDWTGGGQQYQTDISQLADANYTAFAQAFNSTTMNTNWPTPPAVGANGTYGPKAGVHPSLVCMIANATGVNPWYNLPVAINDSSMTAIAAYFAANLNPSLTVTFQFGNENWNSGATGPYVYCAAHQFPPITNAAISSITWASNVATVTTTSPHNVPVGIANFTLVVAGAVPSGYNGSFNCTPTGTNTFTYALASNPGTETTPGTWSGGATSVYAWSGYRCAQLWRLAYDAFGPSGRSRWIGCVDGQQTDPAVGTYNLAGAQYYLNAEAPAYITEFSDIFDQIIVAGYFGNLENSETISGMTAGTTTTVTVNTSKALNTHVAGSCPAGSITGSVLTVAGATAAAISSIVWNSGSANGVTVTTTAAHNLTIAVGTYSITIAGATPAGFNGTYACTATGTSTFTYTLATNPGTETTPGTWAGGISGTYRAGQLVNNSTTFITTQASGTTGVAGTYNLSSSALNGASGTITAGDVVRLFFASTTAGTFGALLNTVDVTVASATTSSWQFTNYGGNSGNGAADTTGLTYSAGSTGNQNYSMNGQVFDLMDDSLTNYGAYPALYATQYTYFAQQIFQAYLTGNASNGYANKGSFNGTPVSVFQENALYGQQNALQAYSVGLVARQYEGGLQDISGSYSFDANIKYNTQFLEYSFAYKFDPGAANGAYTVGACYAANTAAWNTAYAGYLSQFGQQGQPSAWGAVRYTPGDNNNVVWQAILAQTANPQYSDPTPPTTGTYAYVTTNYVANSSTQTFSPGLTTACKLIVALAEQLSGTMAVVFDPGGANITLNEDVTFSTSAIFSGDIPSGLSTRNIQITYSSAGAKSAFVYTASGLTNDAVVSTGTNAVSATNFISVNKGALVIAVSRATTLTGYFVGGGYSAAIGLGAAGGGPYIAAGAPCGLASAYFVPQFSSPIFGVYWYPSPTGYSQCLASYS